MNSFLVVLKKELKDIFRDRKTIFFSILLPIIVFPLIFMFMNKSMENTVDDANKNINIVIQGDSNSSIANILKSQQNINIKNPDDPKEALKDGDIQLIINIPSNFDERVKSEKDLNVDILVDDSSNKSQIASNTVHELFRGLESKIVSDRLVQSGIDPKILKPFNVDIKSGLNNSGEINGNSSMLGSMVPTFIIIFMLSPALAIAADLGAGEKERNTFEPLLSTSCNRNSLLWGKIIAMCVVSGLALILSLGSIYYSLTNFMSGDNADLGLMLSPKALAIMIILCLLLLLAVCALQISISIFARSVKEAGTYLSGIIMPVMILSYIPMFMDAKNMSMLIFNLPVANSVALMKELMAGVFNPTHIGIVFFWQIIYVLASVIITKKMFSKEEVVFRA
ncbi:MAG: ABC transporter permease [Clostridium chrysemydis]|uniref:ABC transporter permease n=1 Tax=Clostridium chrysemydis TaxID=2665504 RepID=UPI003F2A5E95